VIPFVIRPSVFARGEFLAMKCLSCGQVGMHSDLECVGCGRLFGSRVDSNADDWFRLWAGCMLAGGLLGVLLGGALGPQYAPGLSLKPALWSALSGVVGAALGALSAFLVVLRCTRVEPSKHSHFDIGGPNFGRV